jgi:pimeloyl-ACP methyl ester carboxylesterase
MQTQLLFPTDAVPPAGPLPANGERLQASTPDGETLHGVYLKPGKEAAGRRTLILGFGGNAWNAQEVAEYLHGIFPNAHVVAFHYRGYRPSTGGPSADALLADAPLVLHAAAARVRPDRTVAVGFSIGSGVAASLGHNADVDGLILVTPFDSLKAVAAQLYPWLPVGPFFQHEIDTVEQLRGSRLPVAIIAAERDEIIPPPRTDALRQRISNLALDRTIVGTGHNDIYWRNEFRDALREAWDTILPK